MSGARISGLFVGSAAERSPWGLRDRQPLRVALALVAAYDLVLLTVLALRDNGGLDPIAGAWIYQQLALHGALLGAIAGIGLVAALRFARSGSLWAAALTLAALHLCEETAGRAFRTLPPEPFQPGLFLLGWIAGATWVRAGLGDRVAPALRRAHEALGGEFGAIAACAASYGLAGFAKLARSGLDWDHRLIWHVIYSGRPVDGGWIGQAWADALVATPALADLLAWMAIGIQLGGLLLVLGPRMRRLAAASLFGLHLSMFVLGALFDPEVMTLLVVWARLWPGADAVDPAQTAGQVAGSEPTAAPWRTPWLVAAAGALLVAIAWLSPLRDWMSYEPMLPRWPFDP
ncbi:MAG: hypothetical protein H6747_13545 [Deltaproteobacteria bacterium]|nr:hypothetical protein [Deltaproteobacteria bacterium]